jgi:hypothetical protein
LKKGVGWRNCWEQQGPREGHTLEGRCVTDVIWERDVAGAVRYSIQ